MSNERSNPPTRPRAAAGLILLRGDSDDPEVLLGRRAPGSRFMPDVFVVPGGRLDPGDARPSGFPETLPAQPPGVDAESRRRLGALARCALREAFEEAGVLLPGVGTTSNPARAPVWRAYAAAGQAPAFGELWLVARALTPTNSPIRFDTRFWMADGSAVTWAGHGDGELHDIAWVPARDLDRLPIPEATRLALETALEQRRRLAAKRPALSFARFFWRVGPLGARRIGTDHRSKGIASRSGTT